MEIEREGARLFSTARGSGPDVVLLHPTPVHHAFWLPVAERLLERYPYRLILMDLRGHGRSTLGAGITMQTLAEDVHAVLRAWGIERAAFVGCSIGGYLLYEYWRRFPAEVVALAPTCGKPQGDTEINREKRQEWMRAARQPGGLENFFDQMADSLVGPTARQRQPEVRAAARAMMETVTLDAMLSVQQGLAVRPDSASTLATIRVPVCAIAGGEDRSSTPAEMHLVAESIPGAEFHVLPNAGHYAPLEQPHAVAEILGGFLQRAIASSTQTTAGPVR